MNGKHREAGAGPEDQYDPEGYDDTQRAEILEVEGQSPSDGVIETDLVPDLGGGDADDDEIEDEADDLTVEDSDDLFDGIEESEPADFDPAGQDIVGDRVGNQGNEADTNRQDTQNVT